MNQPLKNESDTYVEIALTLQKKDVDLLCDYIVENITGGLVLEDEESSPTTELLFYVSPSESESVEQKLKAYIKSIDHLDSESVQMRSRTVSNLHWEEEYRKSVTSVFVSEDVVVRPPWAESAEDVIYDIILEPKMAFGTGRHETTRSCLSQIRKYFQDGSSFLDLGCGSGILSILAAKLGATYIKSIDIDVAAVDNCVENFVINKVTTPNDVVFGSIEKCDDDQPYDFVCANIIKQTILEMINQLIDLTKPGGTLMLSGLLAQDEQEIRDALSKRQLTDIVIYPDNEWRTFIVKRG